MEFSYCHPYGSKQIAVRRAMPLRVDQMRDYFGVGLRAKDIALRLQSLTQRFVVFDDAVVDDGDFVPRQMRMRVVGRRRAVRRPPRMRYSGRRMELASVGLQSQIGDTRRRDQPLENRRCAAIDHGKAGGIVAAIFEPPDSFDQDWNHVASRCRANDAAHDKLPFAISLTWASSPVAANRQSRLAERAPASIRRRAHLRRSCCRRRSLRRDQSLMAQPANNWTRCARHPR